MAITGGGLLNKVPSAQQQALSTNYIDFAGGSTVGSNNIYQILWKKKLRFLETELSQDFFHK